MDKKPQGKSIQEDLSELRQRRIAAGIILSDLIDTSKDLVSPEIDHIYEAHSRLCIEERLFDQLIERYTI